MTTFNTDADIKALGAAAAVDGQLRDNSLQNQLDLIAIYEHSKKRKNNEDENTTSSEKS
jgi:hypothetical protein